MAGIRKYLLLVFFLWSVEAGAQITINFSRNNGLPSNHAYGIYKDQYDYLWITTTNGIAKYNGYEFKVYTISDGLPKNDIWGLFIDKRKRIWIQTFSNKIGYFYADKYHNVPTTDEDKILYPIAIANYNGGVMFLTRDNASNNHAPVCVLGVEKQDSIRFLKKTFSSGFVVQGSKIIDISDKIKVFKYDTLGGAQLVNTCSDDILYNLLITLRYKTRHVLNNNLLLYREGDNILEAYNTNTCTSKRIQFFADRKKEKIVYEHLSSNRDIVITQNNIYVLDSNLKIIRCVPMSKFLPDDKRVNGSNVYHYFEDNFWGEIIATNNNGFYIHYKAKNHFTKKETINLSNYSYIGNIGEDKAYWWNKQKQRFLVITGKNHREKNARTEIGDINKMIANGTDQALFFTPHRIYRFNAKDFEAQDISISVKKIKSKADNSVLKPEHSFVNIKDLIPFGTNKMLVLYPGAGLRQVSFFKDDSITIRPIQKGDFLSLVYDKQRMGLWMYNNDMLLLYSFSKKILKYKSQSIGIKSINKVLVDSIFGNLILSDGVSLYYLDSDEGIVNPLFDQYNFKEIKYWIKKDIIIAADGLGITFCKMLGKNKFSTPIYYPNIKNSSYRNVEDLCVVGNTIYLKTDQGTYNVDIPGDTLFPANQNKVDSRHTVIVKYRDNTLKLPVNKKLNIQQRDFRILFDVVSPIGSGKARYLYLLKGQQSEWTELNTSELYLPDLKPGKTYNLSIVAKDDIWKSRVYNLQLYVIPYWYQTQEYKTIFWTAGGFVFLFFVFVLVIITRHYVIKASEKKRSGIEIELKTLYSQINPHFIFNTLNSVLFFIKKKRTAEAYEYVSKFSNLLRSYLDSSKSRFTTLKKEIENLEYYLDLQQGRFLNLFNYKIEVQGITELDSVKFPSMLLQPLVENAINHGLIPLEQNGFINVIFKKINEQELTCVIEDNGIGREASLKLNATNSLKKPSQGGLLIAELVSLLNKHDGTRITIQYIDKKLPDVGTIVIVNIVYPYYE